MDPEQFDRISRFISSGPSRRRVLAGLLGSVLSALALGPAEAKKKGKKGKGKKKGKKGGVCASGKGKCQPVQPECTSDLACGPEKICEGNKCVPGCRSDSGCLVVSATMVRVCEGGQCVQGCLNNDFHCPAGKVCGFEHGHPSIVHHCVGCRNHGDCPECGFLCDIEGNWECYFEPSIPGC